MESAVSKIYELLDQSPNAADQFAKERLAEAESQGERDSINWARAYALVELGQFATAEQIWTEIFERTHDHKALHQIGYVHRKSGQLQTGLETYLMERALIPRADTVAIGANLYELVYCNHLLGNRNEAHKLFQEYEELEFEEQDQVERGCFFRLKGDINIESEPAVAREAYLQSLEMFREARDPIACSEIEVRLAQF